MPPRPALAPGTVPCRLTGFGALPQCEVQGVFLSLVHFDPGACLQIVQVPFRKLAVPVEFFHLEVDVAVHVVGHALAHKSLDDSNDLFDIIGGSWLHIRPLYPESAHVVVVGFDVLLRQLLPLHTLLVTPIDDLVVDVGVVAHVGQVVTREPQVTGDDVEGHRCPRVPDMAVVIYSHTAGVHSHLRWTERFELLFFSTQSVVNTQGHVQTSRNGETGNR